MEKQYRTVKAKDRHPDDARDVTVFVGGQMLIGCYEGGGWYTEELGPRTKVDYWLEEIQPTEMPSEEEYRTDECTAPWLYKNKIHDISVATHKDGRISLSEVLLRFYKSIKSKQPQSEWVSEVKLFDIDFAGDCKALIRIKNNIPEIKAAINGRGNTMDKAKIKVKWINQPKQ